MRKPPSLRPRIEAALRDARFPQALELARQQLAQSPSEAHGTLIRDVCSKAIRYQIDCGNMGDARRWLDDAERFDGPPAWSEELALWHARLGDGARARRLLAPESTVLPRVLGHLADHALQDRQKGREQLADDLRAGFDAVVSGFAHHEKGDDEAARQALQAIGLQSPFLEWKLLLRGLIAYSSGDDTRAAENWQRLDAERLPAQLAAPFRYLTDSAYRNRVASEAVERLARRADAVAHPMLAPLRELQRALASPEGLPRALKLAEPLVGLMRVNFPHLMPKLASCFYWLIVQGGQPEDLARYERLFGAPADDPHFHRLKALIMESYPNYEGAHEYWKLYFNEIEQTPQRWPGDHGRRVRAAILVHMGDNAQEQLDDNDARPELEEIFELLSGRAPKPPGKPLNPSAEVCYRAAMKLSPASPKSSARLMDLLQEQEKWVEAEAIGALALQHHPEVVELRLDVASAQQAQGKIAEALANLKHALKSNPLDRDLQAGVATLNLQNGRAHTLLKEFDQARAAFRESIDLGSQITAHIARAACAATELKAGNADQASRLIDELSNSVPAIVSAYLLTVELGRAKIAKKFVAEHQTRFEEGLNQNPPATELGPLVCAMLQYREETPVYRGLGAHEKKVLGLIQAAVAARPSEEDLTRLGWMLLEQDVPKLIKACGEQGKKRFPNNPSFPFILGEQEIRQKPMRFREDFVGRQFAQVLRLTEGRNDDRSRYMRDIIDERVSEHPGLAYWTGGRKTAGGFPF
jgi:tetratricopeptide (TPR) repeat protein